MPDNLASAAVLGLDAQPVGPKRSTRTRAGSMSMAIRAALADSAKPADPQTNTVCGSMVPSGPSSGARSAGTSRPAGRPARG